MNLSEWISAALILAGMFFFVAGTVGLLRFPDFFTRLHALTKADNLGFGLVIALTLAGLFAGGRPADEGESNKVRPR